MKRVIPAVERRRVQQARRHRRLAFMKERRPDSLRTAFLATSSSVQDAWDAIAIAMIPAVTAMDEFELAGPAK